MSIVSNHTPEVIDALAELDALAGAPASPEPTEEEVNAMAEAGRQLLSAPPTARDTRDTRQHGRRSRPLLVRSVRLVAAPLAGVPGIVSITVGRDQFTYWLSPLAADFGRAFRLEKFGDGGESYAVNLGGDGHHPSCECKGSLAHGHCKHVSGIQALVAAGKL